MLHKGKGTFVQCAGKQRRKEAMLLSLARVSFVVVLILTYTPKIKKKSVSGVKCQFSPVGQNMIQPLLEPFEQHNQEP